MLREFGSEEKVDRVLASKDAELMEGKCECGSSSELGCTSPVLCPRCRTAGCNTAAHEELNARRVSSKVAASDMTSGTRGVKD